MSAFLLSPFERLLIHEKQPISVYVRLYHQTYTPAFPATHLLSLLPLPSKLSLRHVSPTTKTWIDSANPSVFSNLSTLFPLNIFSAEEISALHNTSPQCHHLTVTLSENIQPRKPSDAIPLPPFPRLTHLSLTAPNHDPFQPLLSFRLALQCANVPRLTHLTLTNLSVPGILALRWGSFTSFRDAGWTGANVWQSLKSLDVKTLAWWADEEQQEQEQEHYHHHYYHHNYSYHTSQSEPQTKARRQKEHWRSHTRVLHDWLHSFAANSHLHTFRFEWVNSEGPNPLLLDELVSVDGKKEWFSAPGIRWTSVREIWLGNVVVSALDVRRMKARMAGLERIVVRPHCLHVGLGGGGFVEDGMVWVEVDVEGDRVGLLSEVNNNEFSVEAVRGNYHMGGVEEGDRASMVLPFVLDLEPEEGGFL